MKRFFTVLFIAALTAPSGCKDTDLARSSPAPVPTEAPAAVPDDQTAPEPCPSEALAVIGGVQVRRFVGGDAAVYFQSGLMIDADGAPNAYHPAGRGLDYLANAGRPGRWWGLVTDTGEPDGEPVVQGPDDPFPGYYVSSTSLQDLAWARTDPRRYVDSSRVPYVALPPRLPGGVGLGDLGVVINLQNGRRQAVIFADVGPRDQLGEGSIALARGLGLNADPKRGGTRSGIFFVMFPGSGEGRPLPEDWIESEAGRLFEAFGAMDRARACTAAR